jgi:hypothetical protein
MKMSAYETNALPPGATVKHYTVVDLLGFDHQGCLYRAESPHGGHRVMLYEFLPAGLAVRGTHGVQPLPGKADALAKAVAAYATRLRAAGLVGHPALPTLDDIWTESSTLYAVGPLRSGHGLLAELGQGDADTAPTRLTTWARTLCDALEALHRHDLMHGNLSPEMIRVLDNGELQLPLVGAPVYIDETPPWLAPEQHPLNPKPVGTGPWTDVYQFSALMHLFMTGQNAPSVMRRWEGAPLERLTDLGDAFSPEWVVATRRGLSMHASVRPQTPAKWLELAGMPDRREQPRHDAEASAFDAANRRFPAAAAPATDAMAADEPAPATPADAAPVEPELAAAVAPAVAPLSLGAGHQPLPPSVQERLDRVETQRRAERPTWLLALVLLAVAAVVMVVIGR